MVFARHSVCILVAILAFTLLGVESRRGGRLQKGSLRTMGSFVIAANRAGNDELEDEMTGFEDEELSESLDESQILPVPTDENAKFCADSASAEVLTCKLRGQASFACKDASKFHQDSCQSMGPDAESMLGAADQETPGTISQKITAVLNPSKDKNYLPVNLDYASLKASINGGQATSWKQNCLTGKAAEQPTTQNLTSISGGVSMEIATIPGAGLIPNLKEKGASFGHDFDCQIPISVEVSGKNPSFVASRVELAWADTNPKEARGCNLFCQNTDSNSDPNKHNRATVRVELVNSKGATVWPPPKSSIAIGQQQCSRTGATPEKPCTVNIYPPVEASKIRITILGCSQGAWGGSSCKAGCDMRGSKAVGVKKSMPWLSSAQKHCSRHANADRPVTFQISAFSQAGSFGWDEPIKAQLKGILEKTKFGEDDSWIEQAGGTGSCTPKPGKTAWEAHCDKATSQATCTGAGTAAAPYCEWAPVRVIRPEIRDEMCNQILAATQTKFNNWITPIGGQFVQDPGIAASEIASEEVATSSGNLLLGAGNWKSRRRGGSWQQRQAAARARADAARA